MVTIDIQVWVDGKYVWVTRRVYILERDALNCQVLVEMPDGTKKWMSASCIQ